MLFVTLSLRRIRRHWRLNVPILVVLVLGSAFASGLPMLASVIAGQTLFQSLQDSAVPMRNVEIRGEALSDDHEDQLRESVGDWIEEKFEVREVTHEAETIIRSEDGEDRSFSGLLYLSFWSFEELRNLTEILEGRMPADVARDEPSMGRVLEVAIGLEAAIQMALSLGDEIKFYDAPVTVRIVGILSPEDTNAGIWWGDSRLLPFNIQRETGLSQTDTVHISMLLPPEVMMDELPSHEMSCAIAW
jgi:hypothetical protein